MKHRAPISFWLFLAIFMSGYFFGTVRTMVIVKQELTSPQVRCLRFAP